MESHIRYRLDSISAQPNWIFGAEVQSHVRLGEMSAASGALTESETPPAPHERPWLFAFLIAPDAVVSLGLLGGGLSFLLRQQGVDPSRIGSAIALLVLPHAIYFFWGPITDFWLRRRTWLILASLAAAATFTVAFMQPHLASSRAVGLMFLGACFGVIVPAACGGMMGTLKSELNRRRASSAYQIGSLAIGALAVFAIVSLSAHLRIVSLGLLVAAMIVAPSLLAFAAPPQKMIHDSKAREELARIGREFKQTFFRWEAIPYTLLVLAPFSSGALIGLLPGIATDYGVTGAQVAWMNGLGGALLTSAGAYAASLIPVRVRASVAFPISGLVNAATAAIFAIGPQRPAVYFTGTVLFLFSIGAGYALFTRVSLEFRGGSGKSGSARYTIINSLGNLPVAYMSYLDGRAYAHWGPRAMPAADAIIASLGASLLLAHFVVSRRRQRSKVPDAA
jgi:MFS transporter, PAT family, beta-lactamase induction signal transducer AmpG